MTQTEIRELVDEVESNTDGFPILGAYIQKWPKRKRLNLRDFIGLSGIKPKPAEMVEETSDKCVNCGEPAKHYSRGDYHLDGSEVCIRNGGETRCKIVAEVVTPKEHPRADCEGCNILDCPCNARGYEGAEAVAYSDGFISGRETGYHYCGSCSHAWEGHDGECKAYMDDGSICGCKKIITAVGETTDSSAAPTFTYDGLDAVIHACVLLDVIKQEWGEAWSAHDQAVRDGLSRMAAPKPDPPHYPCVCGHPHNLDDGSCTVCVSCLYTPVDIPSPQEFECSGSINCDICGRDEPHNHSAWDVERERYCRPLFEKFFEARLVTNHAGLDPSGTYGWALHWKTRNSLRYQFAQVEVAWQIWLAAWWERGEMFSEMKDACAFAVGETTDSSAAPHYVSCECNTCKIKRIQPAAPKPDPSPQEFDEWWHEGLVGFKNVARNWGLKELAMLAWNAARKAPSDQEMGEVIREYRKVHCLENDCNIRAEDDDRRCPLCTKSDSLLSKATGEGK